MVILMAGKKATGKTYFIKKLIENISGNRHVIVYDRQYHYPDEISVRGVDMDTFVGKLSSNDVTNHMIVFEEATIFFSTRKRSTALIDILISSRHSNNIVVFAFHSISDIPEIVLKNSEYLVLKKTHDTTRGARDKLERFEGVFERYLELRESEEYILVKGKKIYHETAVFQI